MITKRLIPCLDVKNKNVVKGESFTNLSYTGNPAKLAKKYYQEGADELICLDITASIENKGLMTETIKSVAREIFIPLTVGGGINKIEEIEKLLNSGADKVSINTAAVQTPKLITRASAKFGRQCVVVAIDGKKIEGKWKVFIKGGKEKTNINVIEWAKKIEKLGAGEILLTSIDKDGKKQGYDVELVKRVSEIVNIPVIASGGAGTPEDIFDVIKSGKADASLAASIFHYNKYTVDEVKRYLKEKNIRVRI